MGDVLLIVVCSNIIQTYILPTHTQTMPHWARPVPLSGPSSILPLSSSYCISYSFLLLANWWNWWLMSMGREQK